MKLAASLISAFLTVGATFKLPNSQNTQSAVRGPMMTRRTSFNDMPYTRRTACPTVPLRPGLPIPGFEDRTWNLPDIFRKRMNQKIRNFETGQCDTMLVRIEKNHVIDICFHYEWEIGNPWSMETTCVSEKYREIDCYMGAGPFAPMSKSCEAKEKMPLFLTPSLMNTGLGALLFDFDPSELSSESSSESSDESYDSSESYEIIPEDDPSSYRFNQNEPDQWYYVDANGNVKISDCQPYSPGCILDMGTSSNDASSNEASSNDASSGIPVRRRKREIPPKRMRTTTHGKRLRYR